MNEFKEAIGLIGIEPFLAIVASVIVLITDVIIRIFSSKRNTPYTYEYNKNNISYKRMSILDSIDTSDSIDKSGKKNPLKIDDNANAKNTTPKPKILTGFLIIIIIYLLITSLVYQDVIFISKDILLKYIGLFLMMVAGMFCSVIKENYESGRGLFDVDDNNLIYPLLFSVFVFYPILIISDSDINNKSLFYTSFLNGYFWKTVITKAEEAMGKRGKE